MPFNHYNPGVTKFSLQKTRSRQLIREHRNSLKTTLQLLVLATCITVLAFYPLARKLQSRYAAQFSLTVSDRNGVPILMLDNSRGYYAQESDHLPSRLKTLLLQKEDRFFYLHPGLNPLSIIRDALQAVSSRKLQGSSTLTQQLVKTLLTHENQRTLTNKIVEAFYALALELYTKKDKILAMYLNTAYFGNRVQGLSLASRYYYGLAPHALGETEILELLATLNNPSHRYPQTFENSKFVPKLARSLGLRDKTPSSHNFSSRELNLFRTPTAFEIETLPLKCATICNLALDVGVNDALRQILKENLDSPALREAQNGAIVVIKLTREAPYNELIAIVGSPNPSSGRSGHQINMALEPRPIGSTIKPFIYAKAFEAGARPYTLTDDREYKYAIGTGFSLYPKNYDGKYRGIVTLHEALANSLNVPAVKTLEFVEFQNFKTFLEETLGFHSRQPLETYGLGIALGGLEMDLLTLSHYFTVFPEEGVLKPLKVYAAGGRTYLRPPMSNSLLQPKKIFDSSYVQLVNKILSDQAARVDQFGIKGNLNLTYPHYAVKTGTTYDYHDSWSVGYTPHFVVGVWVGNSSNEPIRQVGGQAGAGKIWHDVMEYLLNSHYNERRSFDFSKLKEFTRSGTIEYGLESDLYAKARTMLQDTRLILEPHPNDLFVFDQEMRLALKAQEEAVWFRDGENIGRGKTLIWQPEKEGRYRIVAETNDGRRDAIEIDIVREEM